MTRVSKQLQLKRLVTEHGISQADLAQEIKRSPAFVSRLMAGHIRASQSSINAILAYLCKRLGRSVSYEELFGSPAECARGTNTAEHRGSFAKNATSACIRCAVVLRDGGPAAPIHLGLGRCCWRQATGRPLKEFRFVAVVSKAVKGGAQ